MTDSSGPDALYEWQGALINPLAGAVGPWAARTQNGGTVGALLATLGESADTDSGLVSLNIQIEIYRPVPLIPLQPTVTVLRSGRRLQIVRVTLSNDGVDLAEATMVRLRPLMAPQEDGVLPQQHVAPPPGIDRERRPSPFFTTVDCRVTTGGFDKLGPGAAWMRVTLPIIAGMPISTFAAAVLVADAGSGLSSIVARDAWNYPNVTLSLHMHRAIRGEWILVSSETAAAGNGMAQVNTVLGDEFGESGRAHQTLCLEPA